MNPAACTCVDVEPHNGTYDLDHRIQPPLTDARYAVFERVGELRIQCRTCHKTWTGEPLLGGGVYGDTRWWWEELPAK